jgi:EAL and modified HD-GYP domain-containing signal transduction protein
MLAALLPIRDHRDRVVAYELTAYPANEIASLASSETDARSTLELLSTLPLPRLANGRPVHVPVTPALVRDGALSRFASVDAVFVLATQALEDPGTARAVEVLRNRGFRFGLDGFPDGSPLPTTLAGATIAIGAAHIAPLAMASRIQLLLHAGLKPIARNVDDRATRERILALGMPFYSGRVLPRNVMCDAEAEAGTKRAVTMLAAFSDGRPPDASFDAYVRNDARLSAEILRVMRSASLGVRGPRTVEHAFTVLGRDALLDRMTSLVARLISECAGDPELALISLRRARMCERLATALERPPHPRTRRLAGLVSVLDSAFGVPPSALNSHVALSPVLTDVAMDRLQPLGQLVDVIDAYDNGWWPDMRSRCHNLGISPALVRDAYFDSWRDAREELNASKTGEP